ncbi:MAG TPA: hypothetical protein VK400_08255 [Pyrinomonadaceae bacterium]|nr:hypothetical protein [Pyrinomonadaceae bacterium]
MRNSLFILLIALVMTFSAACGLNRDAEVNSFVAEMDKLTAEIVSAVDEKPGTPGVERAQKLLDARKTELKANFEKLKDVRGFQLSRETTKKFTDAVAGNVESVNSLQIKYVDKTSADENFRQKLNKLSSDFNSIFGI